MTEPMPKLTPKQQRFVQAFAANGGNASRAAEAAGYRLPRSQGARLLTKVDIIGAIDELRRSSEEAAIADRIERQRFWTEIARDPTQATKDRLRASELLGKAQGDFIVRHEINEPMQLVVYLPDNGRDPVDSRFQPVARDGLG